MLFLSYRHSREEEEPETREQRGTRERNMDSDDIGQGWLFRNDSTTLTRTGRSDLLKRAACVSTGDAAGTMQGPPAKPNIDSVNSRCTPEQSSEHRNRMLTRSATRGGRLLTENTLSAGAGAHGDMDADDEALEEEDLDCQEPVEGVSRPYEDDEARVFHERASSREQMARVYTAGIDTTFRLRRLVAGVGVESVFPIYLKKYIWITEHNIGPNKDCQDNKQADEYILYRNNLHVTVYEVNTVTSLL
ncbi:unnamed protein product [Urochloa humidicola]